MIENRSGVITVDNKVVYGHGAYDGIISVDLINDKNSIFRAYALLAMHKAPENVLIIGLGSGSWSQVISNMTSVKRITIVEINSGYIELISRYEEVSSLLNNPKVEIVIDDVRRWLNNNPDAKFDFIVANTTYHWRANATNILSLEYYNLIRKHLNPGGIYYFNSTSSDETKKTALSAFKYGLRVMNFIAVSDNFIMFSGQRWENELYGYRIDGKKMVYRENTIHRKKIKEITGIALDRNSSKSIGIKDKIYLEPSLADVGIITDNNMLSEFKNIVMQPPH